MTALSDLFAAQDALATMDQLRNVGVSDSLTRQRVATGEWRKCSDSLIAIAGVPWTWHRRVRAAWLDAGGDTAVSHITAGRLHGFDGLDRVTDIHLTVLGTTHRTCPDGVFVHRSELLDDDACVWMSGIRVVSRPVALIQIASMCHPDVTGKALDSALRDGVAPLTLDATIRAWRRRGVRGPAKLLRLLMPRVDTKLPRSWFQRLAKRILATRGLTMVDEHEVTDPATGRRLAELDLAIPELKIGVECQSWEWHSTPTAQARDAARKRRLRVLGWEIVDLWWVDLHRIDGVVEEVQYLIDERRPRLLA